MIPWILLDTAKTTDGKELRLYQHDKDFSFKIGNLELMNSRMHGSEEALAELACEEISQTPDPRILIGGLGMGFTLRAALNKLPAQAEVVVAELMPAVVKWNRSFLSDLAGNPLGDERVTLHEADVAKIIKAAKRQYDAILLDVDNGPEGLSRKENAALYNLKGLYNAYAALRPNGVLAIWSSGPDRFFVQRMNHVGFDVDEVRVRARSGPKGGSHYLIWLAKRE